MVIAIFQRGEEATLTFKVNNFTIGSSDSEVQTVRGTFLTLLKSVFLTQNRSDVQSEQYSRRVQVGHDAGRMSSTTDLALYTYMCAVDPEENNINQYPKRNTT
jgi:hypothetical protein